MYDEFETVDYSITAIRSLNELIMAAFHQDEEMRQPASGIYFLLEKQINNLAAANDINRKQFTDLEKQLEKFSAESALNSPESGRARELRQSFIQEKSKAGFEVGDIAQALNLKKSAVERVIAQLQSGGGEASSNQMKSATK